MTRNEGLRRSVIGVVVMSMVIAAALFALIQRARSEIYSIYTSMENDRIWHVAHVNLDEAELGKALLAYTLDPTPDNAFAVEEQFDFLWVRLDVLLQGQNRDWLDARGTDEVKRYLFTLREFLETYEDDILELTPERAQTVNHNLDTMHQQLFGRTNTLSQLSLRENSEFSVGLVSAYRRTTTLFIGFAVVIAIFALVLWIATSRNLRLRREAERANAAKTRFLATVSHELRTPLNGILGSIYLFNRKQLGEDELAHLDTLTSCSKALEAQLADILDFSQMEHDVLELNPRSFSPSRFLAECFQSFTFSAEAKGLRYERHVGDMPPRLIGDSIRLRQIVLNLLSNAVKYTKSGHVILRAEWLKKSQRLQIQVEDSGTGIAPEDKNHIFTAFHRIKNHDTFSEAGNGLGLSIVHRLLAEMKGEIEVESMLGQGSVFRVTIPLTVEESEAFEEQAAANDRSEDIAEPLAFPPSPSPASSCHVLVAEDNAVNARILTLVLKQMGITSEVAQNGEEAFERAHRNPEFSLILMDIQMPVLSGIEATEKLRASGYRKPIIAVTANATADDHQACLRAGMDAFLTKPIKPQQLREAIGRVGLKGLLSKDEQAH
jgi:signal transduction histidine kinase/CheY-like chemotaxis protein